MDFDHLLGSYENLQRQRLWANSELFLLSYTVQPSATSLTSPLTTLPGLTQSRATLASLIILENMCLLWPQGLCTFYFLCSEHFPQISVWLVFHFIQVSAHMSTYWRELSQPLRLSSTVRPPTQHHCHTLSLYLTLFSFPALTYPDMLYIHLCFFFIVCLPGI